jgi:hypothetical protein
LKKLDVELFITFVEKNILLAIPSLDHMMWNMRDYNSGDSRHSSLAGNSHIIKDEGERQNSLRREIWD